jgi:hypothetical protein
MVFAGQADSFEVSGIRRVASNEPVRFGPV